MDFREILYIFARKCGRLCDFFCILGILEGFVFEKDLEKAVKNSQRFKKSIRTHWAAGMGSWVAAGERNSRYLYLALYTYMCVCAVPFVRSCVRPDHFWTPFLTFVGTDWHFHPNVNDIYWHVWALIAIFASKLAFFDTHWHFSPPGRILPAVY